MAQSRSPEQTAKHKTQTQVKSFLLRIFSKNMIKIVFCNMILLPYQGFLHVVPFSTYPPFPQQQVSTVVFHLFEYSIALKEHSSNAVTWSLLLRPKTAAMTVSWRTPSGPLPSRSGVLAFFRRARSARHEHRS